MDNRKEYQRELYYWYKSHGICYNCKIRPVEEGKARCLVCKMDLRERQKTYRDNMTEDQRDKMRKATNDRKARLRAAGQCVDCGKRPAANGRIRCSVCLRKDRERQKQRNIDRGRIPQELRANGTYCNMCCRPLCNGEKLCAECYPKACEALKQARVNINKDKHPWKKANKIIFEVSR